MEHLLYIAIPLHDRLGIAAECVPTIYAGSSDDDVIALYDDGSTQNHPYLAKRIRDSVSFVETTHQIGIEEQRRKHFLDFVKTDSRFTHLYLTDADAIHDCNWSDYAFYLQRVSGGLPVCLYNTQAHVRLEGNTIEDDPEKPYMIRRVAPGVSYLLTREQAERVAAWLVQFSPSGHWNWDWTVPTIIGGRFAVARQSHVDHIGLGGYHHPENEGLDGGDRALNPTDWLVNKRIEVVQNLS